jgi:tRNA (guanine-N7-)-methyltransferase
MNSTDRTGDRQVRSFVLRGGRLTEGQKRALEELWPRFGIEDKHEPVNFSALFGNEAPVIVEIGFGDGEASWQMALARPDQNFVGVEVHRPGVGHLLLKLEEKGIENLRIVCADAVEFLQARVPEQTLDGVRIYFPDPWPKKRHHKRRIIRPEFVGLLASRMRTGGVLHIATDWGPYAEHILMVMADSREFENLSETGDFSPRPQWRPDTKYERRGERLGHSVFDLVFKRGVNS